MKKKVKLVWQFYGMDALKTAEHHLVHLNEYIQTEKIVVTDKGTELINELSSVSFIVVEDSLVKELRIALNPQKGFWVK